MNKSATTPLEDSAVVASQATLLVAMALLAMVTVWLGLGLAMFIGPVILNLN